MCTFAYSKLLIGTNLFWHYHKNNLFFLGNNCLNEYPKLNVQKENYRIEEWEKGAKKRKLNPTILTIEAIVVKLQEPDLLSNDLQ